jgi:exonuclease III
MKLITLNTWGGRRSDEINLFLQKHADVDIFCLQEVHHNAKDKEVLFKEVNLEHLDTLKNQLPGYQYLFHPHIGDWWGLAMFIKKDIQIIDSGEVFVHKNMGWNYELELQGHTAKNLQYATIETRNGLRTIINFHGLWNGQGKDDSDERLLQSQNIITFLKTLTISYVLVGDFNLSPDTISLGMLEDHGMRNLIKEYGVFSTRTPLYDKENKFADYVLVSGDIDALDFSVLPDVVSDHSPLYLEFK